MTSTRKVLGQLVPAAVTLSTLYTVPSSTSTVCSTLVACNLTGVQTNIRVAVRPSGAAIDPKHYLEYDIVLPGANSHILTIGITLATTDVISVYSTSGAVAFSLFGEETS